MASPLTVKVHPVVFMTMVDSYERRSQKAGLNNRALGTLLGFYEKNVVQITNCYAIPFREAYDDILEINDNFNQQMWQVAKRSAPTEQIVGWFFTVGRLPHSCLVYHNYYTNLINDISLKKELPPVILLTMDVSFSVEPGRLPIQAYIKSEAGIPGHKSQAGIFQPLKVVLDAFPGENVALRFIMKGVESERREIHLEKGLDKLEDSTEKMVKWLSDLLEYVNQVLKHPEQADPIVGRKLMEVVTHASTQVQPDKFGNLIKNSLRDYMMISYLSNLTKTELALQEKFVSA